MPTAGPLKPTHKAIQAYYDALKTYAGQQVEHEGALETAFSRLLADTARPHGWTLIPKMPLKVDSKTIIPDGTLRDEFYLRHGYWEAKDTHDDLDAEIRAKIRKGYPLSNTIFEDTRQAVLFQNGQERNRFDLTNPQHLVDLLNDFFAHVEPDYDRFDHAVDEFKERVPELAQGLDAKIKKAHKDNPRFETAFGKFFELCQQTLNPNIRRDAVDEMLVQHLLTERLFRTIFDDPDFTRRNVIAAEIESVIDALTSQSFSRAEFLKSLDRFYKAIEGAAKLLTEFTEKQHFLNTVYERFFQGYSVKVADTHGIVYTPQEIVDFMCASVAEVLQSEFGLTLGSPGVNILDPCTGTGNFIVNILRRIPKKDLPRMYAKQLFANEVMLLPYYIAALNIEHAYYDLTGKYEPFEGLCFVDTLDLAEEKPHLFTAFNEKNTERVERQKMAEITVVIGNPPYNVGQLNENDNNKNRKYPVIDSRVRETYVKDSAATLTTKLYDPYVKFFRWAVDRLDERDGVVCLVSNNSFVDQIAFDGMRRHLAKDFTSVYHLHLEGNVRQNPKLSGTAYNVFGIQVGVGITVAVRREQHPQHRLFFHRVDKLMRKEAKLAHLAALGSLGGTQWRDIIPDKQGTWLWIEGTDDFAAFLPIGTKSAKADDAASSEAIFALYSLGVSTNRDDVVYDFHPIALAKRVEQFCDDYNAEVDRYKRKRGGVPLDEFLDYSRVKWSETLKHHLARSTEAKYAKNRIRSALYRPFAKLQLYYAALLNDRPALFGSIFPTAGSERENMAITLTTFGSEKPFMTLAIDRLADLHLVGAGAGAQAFPFYVYDEDGSNRRENITDWAMTQFRDHYGEGSAPSKQPSEPAGLSRRDVRRKDRRGKPGGSPTTDGSQAASEITKWDIFHYVYGILHHPGYRTKFADNLKRELPRIPFAPDFRAFAAAGQELTRLHLDYEQLEPYPLKFVETDGVPLSYRVEDKMRLIQDKTELRVNPSLTLAGIPPAVFDYRLGNRSALDWVIDQYRVTEDARSGIRSDPNRVDDAEYIVRLVGQVIRVSLETVRIVNALPEQFAETPMA